MRDPDAWLEPTFKRLIMTHDCVNMVGTVQVVRPMNQKCENIRLGASEHGVIWSSCQWQLDSVHVRFSSPQFLGCH